MYRRYHADPTPRIAAPVRGWSRALDHASVSDGDPIFQLVNARHEPVATAPTATEGFQESGRQREYLSGSNAHKPAALQIPKHRYMQVALAGIPSVPNPGQGR